MPRPAPSSWTRPQWRAAGALVVEGEAGIGKTALWTTLVQQSRDRGFRVLSARPAEAESTLAYHRRPICWPVSTTPTTRVHESAGPQRQAIDRVLLRAEAGGEPTDRRAVVAAFLSILQTLTRAGPVLIAVDDLQWLDPSSAHVLAGATRRLSGRWGCSAPFALNRAANPARPGYKFGTALLTGSA